MDAVVVSGVSGRFSGSKNVWEFRDHLFNGKKMTTVGDKIWPPESWNARSRSKKLMELATFQLRFFSVYSNYKNECDPQLRILTEIVYEAIVDAGVNPQSLRGSNTAIFVALCAIDSSDEERNGIRSMLTNIISETFGLKENSFDLDMDNLVSEGFIAINRALLAIRNGQCDAFIVLEAKLIPGVGEEYVCSGTVIAVYVQRESIAKRVYANIVNCMSNNYGEQQEKFLERIYDESNIDPNEVVYVETNFEDPAEIEATINTLLEGRTTPLLVGHAEADSVLCSVVKVLIAAENGTIPANFCIKSLNLDVPGFHNGKMKALTENIVWNGGLVAINSIGSNGVNAHLILRTRVGTKPSQISHLQIFGCSGRTVTGVNRILQHAMNEKDKGFYDLMSDVLDHPPTPMDHPVRAYTIVNSANPSIGTQKLGAEKRPVWYIFSGVGSQWVGMGMDLMQIAVFKESIMSSHETIKPLGMDLYNLLMNATAESQKSILNNFTTIVAIQVALVDLLRFLGLEPEGVVGHCIGEICCAYVDGCLTQEQAIKTAYWQGKCVQFGSPYPGCMAVIGLPWQEVQAKCPPGVEAGCHNAELSVTVSGSIETVTKFTDKLSKNGTFVWVVNASSVPFHNSDMIEIVPSLHPMLEKVIPNPNLRTKRWVSSWITDGSTMGQHASADYFCNTIVKPVLFYEAVSRIPKNAIVVEIAPHSHLLQAVKDTVGANGIFLSLKKRNEAKSYEYLLNGLGQLYINGAQLSLSKLNLRPDYPVPRGTSMISPLVQMDN